MMAILLLKALVRAAPAIAGMLLLTTVARAKQPESSGSESPALRSPIASFEDCRRNAVSLLKNGQTGKRRFVAAINACRENYPGAALYITCKKQAIKSARSDGSSPEQAINQCRRYTQVASFKPEQPFPVFVEDGQAYFAGVGMNRTLPMATLAPPNFDCSKVKKSTKDPSLLSYILVGNHPQLFAGLASLSPHELATKLNFKKANKDGVDIAGLGRLYGDPHKSAATVYLPASPCRFESKLSKIYSGLNIYYLIDAKAGEATPYFAIAYYLKGQKSVSTAKLVQELQLALGQEFLISHRGTTVTYLAAAELKETDLEQDPKNLCRQPRRHQLLGIVQAYPDKTAKPEYLIIANIKNLCEFGDRLSQRL